MSKVNKVWRKIFPSRINKTTKSDELENKSLRVPNEKYLYARIFYSPDCDDFNNMDYCVSNCKGPAHVKAECCVCCDEKVDCPFICVVAREELIRKGVREG